MIPAGDEAQAAIALLMDPGRGLPGVAEGVVGGMAEHDAARLALGCRAERAQQVSIPSAGLNVRFEPGDTIHTASSYKFAQEEMIALLASAGFVERRTFLDAAGRYALTLFALA